MTPAVEIMRSGPAAQFAASLSEQLPNLSHGKAALRAPQLGDFAAYADILCSERGGFMGGPMSREDAWSDFTNYIAGWLLHGHGLWTVTDAVDTVLGFVLLGLEWEDPEPELGIFMTEAGEGKGVAQAACEAARAYAFDTLGWTSVVSFVDAGNTRCVRLMERLGAQRDASIETFYNDGTLGFRHFAGGVN